jgi:hypothetical protein
MMTRVSILACGILVSVFAGGVQALPMAPAPVHVTAPEVLQVRGFCGLGFHRGAYGYCVRNGVPYGYAAPAPVIVAPPVMVAPRVCPYGYTYAPAYGACVPL